MEKLQKIMNNITKWSGNTFKGQKNPAILYHLKKEVNELIESVEKYEINKPSNKLLQEAKMEYADCFMLLLDSASHIGFSVNDIKKAMIQKLKINEKRKWGKPDENGVIEHIKKTNCGYKISDNLKF